MGRVGWTRIAAVAAALGLVSLLSGCVVMGDRAFGPQVDVIGDVPEKFTFCASGSTGCGEPGQFRAARRDGRGSDPAGGPRPGHGRHPVVPDLGRPEALTFAPSPSYTAELDRLDPNLPPRTHWVGFVSGETQYASDGARQSFVLALTHSLRRGADGAPFAGNVLSMVVIGARAVQPGFPATRPVACGPSPKALYDEVPDDPTVTPTSMSG